MLLRILQMSFPKYLELCPFIFSGWHCCHCQAFVYDDSIHHCHYLLPQVLSPLNQAIFCQLQQSCVRYVGYFEAIFVGISPVTFCTSIKHLFSSNYNETARRIYFSLDIVEDAGRGNCSLRTLTSDLTPQKGVCMCAP